MSRDSQTRMTNDEIRKNDQIQMTKPATAQLRAIGHSGFGFLSSFVIQRLMQIRFIVPMRAEKASDPSVNRTTPGPSQEGSEPSSAPVPLLGGVRGGFMVPMRARSERRLSMNLPTPDPFQEGGERSSAPVPLLGGVRGGFMVLLHASSARSLSTGNCIPAQACGF